MKKQPIAWLLAASMSVMQTAPAVTIIASAAEQSAEILVSAGNVKGKQGETVSVQLSLKGNRGLNAMAVWVKYNSDALELVNISDKGMFGDDAFDAPKNISESPVRLGWTNSKAANSKDGVIAVLEFKIKDTAPDGVYDIELSTKDGENFTADLDSDDPFTDAELAFDGGRITVAENDEAAKAVSENALNAPVITKISVSGFNIKLPKGYEYTYSETPIENFRKADWFRNRTARDLKPNTAYYVYQRETGTSDVSAPAEIVTSKYDISDAVESVSVGADGAEGTVLVPKITYREGFNAEIAGELTYCWSAKDWADPSVSMAESYTVTADDIAYGRELNVTIAAKNFKGLIRSDSLKAGRTDYSGEVKAPEIKDTTADGFVIAAEAGYEYFVSDNGLIPENAEWTSLDSDAAVTGKAAGRTFYVFARVRANNQTNASLPSEPVKASIPDNDATLLKLTVSSGKLTPDFDPEITDYTVIVPYGRSIPRIRTAAVSGRSVAETEQAKGFAEGKNTAVIKVTAENGVDTRLYTVTFIRQEDIDSAAAAAEAAPNDNPESAEAAEGSETANTEEKLPELPPIASNGTVEPCIAGEPEKSGWNAVCEELMNTADGGTVTVKMNDTTELPKEVSACIQSKNVNLAMKMQNGVSWTVNGMTVTTPKTVNMEVSTSPRKSLADMADSLNSEKKAVPVKLYQSGDFGFDASLTIDLSDRYNGYYASLYGKNRKTGDAEYFSGGQAENGRISLDFSEFANSSEYAVIFTSEPAVEDVASSAGAVSEAMPIETEAPFAADAAMPQPYSPTVPKRSGKKRRYRIVRKRRLDDMVFVF